MYPEAPLRKCTPKLRFGTKNKHARSGASGYKTQNMTEIREKKLREAIRQTQPDLILILENVHDPLNINAVLRTADAVGVREVWALDSEPGLARSDFKLGKRSSGGVYKYVTVRLFHDAHECLAAARLQNGGQVFAAHLADNYELSHFTRKTDSVITTIQKLHENAPNRVEKPTFNLFDLDLTKPTTLLFGNEHFGPTPTTLGLCDGFFMIPMVGLAQSLNISVSAAVTLYETFRQRAARGFYAEHPALNHAAQEILFQKWSEMLIDKADKRVVALD
jgi:tRNA (guanosine-2'-O-)-methyltransferase